MFLLGEEQPTVPDLRQFPVEWRECADKKECNKTLGEVLERDEGMRNALELSKRGRKYKYKGATCRMQPNPRYPTTSPQGFYYIW